MQNPLKNKYDIGVIVGRFQVPYLSEAHKSLIDNVMESHKQVIIVLGVSPTLGTKKNPLGYTSRMQMIQESYPKAIVTHVMDMNSDEMWSKTLDTTIRSIFPIGNICLYGGRDSFIKSYSGLYSTFEMGIINKKEGTKIREETGKEVINSSDFRSGIIFNTQNQYPKVFPTVDIAVINKVKKQYEVILGKRHGSNKFRFPGGFVDPTDKNFESAALRELKEEIDVEVDSENIKYLGSNLQKDWRYNSEDERILTSLFKVEYCFGNIESISEFDSTIWMPIIQSSLDRIESSHKMLFQILLNNIKGDK